jgi:hypothetical protein
LKKTGIKDPIKRAVPSSRTITILRGPKSLGAIIIRILYRRIL